MPSIAIVGAGPKAVAISAKADVLNRAFPAARLDVCVYERHSVAAAWAGGHGYTDGLQPLCTLAERDLGFPYSRSTFGKNVAADMFEQFSWHSFAVSSGVGRAQYEQWVLRGRNPPTHDQFVAYLRSALNASGAGKHLETVRNISFDSVTSQWQVESHDRVGWSSTRSFDGVVITGSGPAQTAIPSDKPSPRIFDGITFWDNRNKVEAILDADPEGDRKAVIIGAGGTGAAVAHWFVNHRPDIPLRILGREATLYARHPGYFEDRLFSEEDDWALLSANSRREFVRRLTVGVVWDYVLQNLNRADIEYVCAQVSEFRTLTPPLPGLAPEVVAKTHEPIPRNSSWSGPLNDETGSVFIDARGFNRWAFVDFLDPGLRATFKNADQVETHIDRYLAVTAPPGSSPFPQNFHVPMAASLQGPGASNLMSLGWMADRILSRYMPAGLVTSP